MEKGLFVLMDEQPLQAPAQHRDAAVARDRVQPRPQLDRLVGPGQLAIRREERVLHRVLGFLHGAERVAAEAEHAAVMTVEQGLERGLGTGAHQLDEPFVGCQAQQAYGDPAARARARVPPDASVVIIRECGRHVGTHSRARS